MNAAAMPATSLQKQEIYSKYVKGDLSLRQVTSAVSQIQPSAPPASWPRRVAAALVVVVAAFVMPQWAKRD